MQYILPTGLYLGFNYTGGPLSNIPLPTNIHNRAKNKIKCACECILYFFDGKVSHIMAVNGPVALPLRPVRCQKCLMFVYFFATES